MFPWQSFVLTVKGKTAEHLKPIRKVFVTMEMGIYNGISRGSYYFHDLSPGSYR